jgi:hypothetical protein
MALIIKQIKGSTLIESIVAFTLILLAIVLSLSVITQIQTQQYLRSTNVVYAIKKIHSENSIEEPKRTINEAFSWNQYIIERRVKKSKNNCISYFYTVKTKSGTKILNYGFIEKK